MPGQPRPTRRVSEGLGGRPGPPADPDPGGDHPHPTRNRGAGRGPAYRDVRDAFLALVGHGPLRRPRPGPWTCGLSCALYGCLSVPLPAGAATEPGRDEERDGGSEPAAAHAPAAPALGPRAAARLPAPRGSARGAGGGEGARTGGGRCRQTAPPGGAEPSPIRPSRLEPGSASLPIPHSAPRPPNRPTPPTRAPRTRPRLDPGLAFALGTGWLSGLF